MFIKAEPPPGWWTQISWGTAPDWVAAIGTVGTLAIALAILIADRKSRERSQADRFVTWSSTTYSANIIEGVKRESWVLDVFSHNASDAPIPVAIARSKASVKPNFIEPLSETPAELLGAPLWSIAPGIQTHLSVPLEVAPRTLTVVIDFMDAQGKPWHRNLFTGKYMSERKFKKFRTLAEEDKGKYRDPAEKLNG